MNRADILNEIRTSLNGKIPDAKIHIEEQQGKYLITVISTQFEGLTALARQKIVYAPLAPHIAEGNIHAVTIKTYTPSEWKDS